MWKIINKSNEYIEVTKNWITNAYHNLNLINYYTENKVMIDNVLSIINLCRTFYLISHKISIIGLIVFFVIGSGPFIIYFFTDGYNFVCCYRVSYVIISLMLYFMEHI